MTTMRNLLLILFLWCSVPMATAFTAIPAMSTAAVGVATTSITRVYYQNDKSEAAVAVTASPKKTTSTTTAAAPTDAPPRTIVVPKISKKPTIYPLSSLQELYDFLVEDDRLTAVKYYAPWCKKCQRVGLHYKKLAHDHGDGVVARRQVQGRIRCAEIEYSDVTRLMLDTLRIEAVPTLQLYRGTQLVWQASGKSTSVPALTREVQSLLDLSSEDLEEYLASIAPDDEGILEQAYEDSFFDNGYCMDWEDEASCV